jgi:FAD synthase
MKNPWYTSTISRGDQTGSKYVYPTINLDPAVLPPDTERGVYASLVKLGSDQHHGALYFGPRLVKAETSDVLEIYLLDFAGEITLTEVTFQLVKFLRPVMDFPTLMALRDQVSEDIVKVRKILNEK